MSAMRGVLAAAFALINVNSVTALAAGGVYVDVPQQTVYDFVRLGPATETREDTFAVKCQVGTYQVHVFSKYAGAKRALDILAEVEELLDGADLTVSGHSLMYCALEQQFEAAAEVVAGEKVHHFVQVYRVWTHE